MAPSGDHVEEGRILKLITFILAAMFCSASWGTEEKPSAVPHLVQLSKGELQAIALLHRARPEKPAPLFLFTDPNRDPDDLGVLVVAKYLQEQGFVDLRLVLTTLGDRSTRIRRAQFARTVLDSLGMGSVKVGVGADYGFEVEDSSGALDEKATEGRKEDHQVFIETPLLDRNAVIAKEGPAILERELTRVPDHSAVLLILSGMVDIAALLREAPQLVKRKVAQVVIMGGVEDRLDSRGFVVADHRAYNNTTHQPSADSTYRRVQDLGLPLVVVNREAAYAAPAPRSFYDGMAATAHPVGIYLRDQQRQSLSHLWRGIHKKELPAALTPTWFFQTFTDVDADSKAGEAAIAHAKVHPEDFESIWNQVSKFNLYDPLALLAATPGATDLFLREEVPKGARGNVRIIGKNSIADPIRIRDLLTGLAIESLNPRPRD